MVTGGAALALLLATFYWYARSFVRFPGDRESVQALKQRALFGRFGRLYFGFLLGIGVLTSMTTPLVYVLLFVEASLHPAWAIAAGVGFGIGRSVPALAGVTIGGRIGGPGAAAARITTRTHADRLVGCASSAALIALVGYGIH